MKRLTLLSIVILAATVLFAAGPHPSKSNDAGGLTAHEWGTFTSIAGEDGNAITWQPWGGPTDLPCFVNRMPILKGTIFGTVRMETPVLYFYAPREMTVDASVQFPKGIITEWFPRATSSGG